MLAQASNLHTICVIVPYADDAFDETHWTAFWKFLAGHPPLRCLLYEVPAEDEPGPDIYMLLDALLLLKSQRPALEMRRLTAPGGRMVHPPACWAELRARVP